MARSLEQILKDAKSVPGLRAECSRLGIKRVLRNGFEIATSNGRKDELVAAISRYESEAEAMVEAEVEVTPVATTIKVDPVIEEPSEVAPTQQPKGGIEYTNNEILLKRLTTKYYQGFKSGGEAVIGVREFAQSQLQLAQTNQSLMDVRLFATVAHFKEEILSVARDGAEDGKPNPSTVINLRVELLNRIKKAVNSERQQFTVTKELEGMEPIVTDYLTQSFEAFRSGVIASFSTIAREKRESQGTNFLARRTSTPHASVSNLIEWAIGRLKSLPTKSYEWREVALAIMIVTGRRPAEVMGVGVFKAIDHTNLKFYGQLKKKGESDETVYKIPVIGDTAKEVEIAIQWLQMMNKRTVPASRSLEDKQEAAKQCHDRFSRYLSEVASQVMPKHLVLSDGASWELAENRSRIKPYLSRQIYLQIISKLVQASVNNGVSIDPDLAVTYYSGHYLSVDGKDANAENYLADIVISDMDEIQSLWDWQPDLTVEELKSLRTTN